MKVLQLRKIINFWQIKSITLKVIATLKNYPVFYHSADYLVQM